MKAESSLARKTTAPETSSGIAGRRSGIKRVMVLSAPPMSVLRLSARPAMECSSISVRIGPGQTTLIRIFWGP